VNPCPLHRLLWWCNLILRVASWIVPGEKRLEWRGEWEAEVWHWSHFLVESGRLNGRTEQELARHCWGAFVDALWHRFNRVAVLRFLNEVPRSPRFCIFACLGLLAGLLFGCPTAFFTETIAPAPYARLEHLLVVSLTEKTYWLQPEVLRDLAARWPAKTRTIDSYAVYAYRPSMVKGPRGTESILSARITPGTFGLLGVRADLGRAFREVDLAECENCVVLSNLLWRSQFRHDDQVIGCSLLLNGKNVKVIGVMPLGFRFPAQDIGVYELFERDPRPTLRRSEWPGVLLRVGAGTDAERAKQEVKNLVNRTGALPEDTELRVRSLRDIEKQRLESWASMLLLALALLLVFEAPQLARFRAVGPRGATHASFRWYSFLALKTILLLGASLMASAEFAHLVVTWSSSANAYALANLVAVWLFLLGAHLSLTWAIRDQLARCRVCMRCLGVRVNLGSGGAVLLEQTGVELVCDEGHGALHVPVMASGCIDRERWTYLDKSWEVLIGNPETRIRVS
jgi:hypothetical protein